MGLCTTVGQKKQNECTPSLKKQPFLCSLLHFAERIEKKKTKQNIRIAFQSYDCSLLALDGENFDKFICRRRMFRKLQKVREETVQTFTCDCKTNLHTVTCKHSLGMCILHDLITVPPEWKCNSIEQLKKRGRPKAVRNCLQKQK